MKKFQIHIIIVLTLLVAGSVCSCRDAREKEFDSLIVSLAETDGEIDFDDWNEIVTFVNDNKARLTKFVTDGEIDTEAVKEYISNFFLHRHPSQEIAFNGAGAASQFMAVKFYLERSGSMVPYDSPQGKGEFKACIVRMLNNLPGNPDDNTIFVVNDGVFPYPNDFKQFITDQNIFETTRGIGNPQYTDFGCILDSVLNHNGDNDLSILATDMIYSTKDVGVVNTDKIFSEAEGMTHAVLKDIQDKKAIVIAKFSSSYIGNYYPYNQPQGVAYSGNRPYYIMIVGNNENITRLTRSEQYRNFADFQTIDGFEHQYVFAKSGIYRPFYSFLLSDNDIKGRFKVDRSLSSGNDIKAIADVQPDRDSGDIQLVMAVNLSGMFIENSYLTNPDNYLIQSDDPMDIVSIDGIKQENINPTNKELMEQATHRMVLKMKKLSHNQEVTIRLQNQFPQWVETSSSEDDSNVSAANPDFAETTFGLRHLLRGIYDCYSKQDDKPYYFEMKINISK